MAAQPLFETIGISKTFPGVKALSGVDFRLFPGEIHSLMGQNGAGKSTLINVLTGVHEQDAGEIRLAGETVRFATPLEAEAAGIQTLYQEINLCPNLSVAENIFAGRQPKRRGAIDWKAIHLRAEEALAELNVSLDVTKSLDAYPIAVQQMVAIARAMSVKARVLILDEPTSSLDDGEVARLFDVLRNIRQAGIAILFVTHFLEQTYAISDRITVMRNGEREGEYLAKDLPVEQLVAKMVGHNRMTERLKGGAPDTPQQRAGAAPFLSMQGVARRGVMNPIDLDVQPGQILGLAGLLGSGRTETARLVFGVDKADAGTISVDGKNVKLSSPHDAVRHGIGYCPEDRKKEGIVAALSIRENIILALQAQRGWLRMIGRKKQREIADTYIERLGIKAHDAEQPIGLLSGGNQQKVVLARWLATEPKMLILDEPTRGIDVAAKFEIMDRVLALCAKGLAILFISSEVGEVVRVSHRIAVLRDRRKIADVTGSAVSEDQVYRLIAGGSE
ncbi:MULTISPECIES: sugar ABC transporter ATP-binding protein [Paraburkholderia]|jgi:simple sugar transport system ATP-binding protein|uniref:ABC transporter n=1 Tax=Paraburkholderia hospita TaxID=169430 RepID=A0AAJ5BQI4_9BURK|nr:sugar ABC transporter ATP-binding protein [Paraburkholderia hospita]EUC19313.1 Monosaccharide-transporting ATPase [Burkholderia sp. BT03]SKC91496.1 monosaccharide ABC transporter ATP-binding protein, CUT2 family [Burkholderia sp. CF099]AUT71737.1 sugar ABC transporter ATP-binding protein [Paraburkholderia hospita]AXF02687.1 sugar ABC transporter ATP-binding protein [Paraburkholderia hospita]EIM96127.1 ABC transporter [Paraburkholderia hospita]